MKWKECPNILSSLCLDLCRLASWPRGWESSLFALSVVLLCLQTGSSTIYRSLGKLWKTLESSPAWEVFQKLKKCKGALQTIARSCGVFLSNRRISWGYHPPWCVSLSCWKLKTLYRELVTRLSYFTTHSELPVIKQRYTERAHNSTERILKEIGWI